MIQMPYNLAQYCTSFKCNINKRHILRNANDTVQREQYKTIQNYIITPNEYYDYEQHMKQLKLTGLTNHMEEKYNFTEMWEVH